MALRHLLCGLLLALACSLDAHQTPCDVQGQLVVACAEPYVGVVEATGNNDGTEVEHFLRQVGLGPGFSYCGAFVYAVHQEAGVRLPGKPSAYAWAPSWHPKARRVWERSRGTSSAFQGKGSKDIEAGDVFGIWYTDRGRIAHVGVVKQRSGSYLVTIEGNTNEAGGREGQGVWSRRRKMSQVYCVSRWTC